MTDDALLEGCRYEAFRGPGPGGQKRNKTSSAIRLTHPPTRISVVAGESRSQAENKRRALQRLRLRLAIELRHPIETLHFAPPAWFESLRHGGRLAVAHRNEHYAQAAGLVLDLMAACKGQLADVAFLTGVTTSSVVRFLENEPSLWQAANAIRKAFQQPPLKGRK